MIIHESGDCWVTISNGIFYSMKKTENLGIDILKVAFCETKH